jgi:hypothetical protein
MPEHVYIDQGALFSPDRDYRYLLWRTWDALLPVVLWILLNPSTADERILDPTLRRVVAFSRAWGFGGAVVANAFGLRSTDPERLREVEDPIGIDNDATILAAAARAGRVVVGWGVHAGLRHRDEDLRRLLRPVADLWALKLTKDGVPGHPLYVAGATQPFIWQPRRAA